MLYYKGSEKKFREEKSLRIVEYQWSMIKLIFKVIRGIILLPVVVVVMTLLNHYEGSVEHSETIVNTQSVVEDLYDRN
jgi:hypothetical protein